MTTTFVQHSYQIYDKFLIVLLGFLQDGSDTETDILILSSDILGVLNQKTWPGARFIQNI